MNGISGNKCGYCIHFTQYYTVKSYHNFEATEWGYCDIESKAVKGVEACDNFCLQKGRRVTAEEIENAIKVINELKELL